MACERRRESIDAIARPGHPRLCGIGGNGIGILRSRAGLGVVNAVPEIGRDRAVAFETVAAQAILGALERREQADRARLIVPAQQRRALEIALFRAVVVEIAKRRGAGERFEIERLARDDVRSEEHTSELQSQMRNSYDVLCLTKK